MNILKVSFVSAIETAVKLLAGFVVLKLLAFYSGPEGVGKFGQFQSFLSVIVVLISGSFVSGLVRYVSENKENKLARLSYVKGAFTFGFISSGVTSIGLVVFAQELSQYIFNSEEFLFLFYILAVGLFFIVIYQISISYLNGIRMIKEMIFTKLTPSLFLLFGGAFLIYKYGLMGSLIGLIGMQVVGGIFAIRILVSLSDFSWAWFKPSFNAVVQKDLSSYWFMSIMSLISSAIVLFLVRKHIVIEDSWVSAGLWEAMWKISELSLLLVTTALTVYYVPMLSQAKNNKNQKKLLSKVTMLALVSATIISSMIYVLRDYVVTFLFSKDFLAITTIIKFQLVGGIFKIVGWIIGFHMLIKAKPILFLSSELFFGLTFYLLSISLFDMYGMKGLTYAFLINNIMFFFVGSMYLILYFKKGLFANG